MSANMNTIDPTGDHVEKKEKRLSRQELRFQERIKSEVESTFKVLCDRFLDFFTQHDNPESQEVIDKIHQLSAQWRIYCKRKNLIASLYPAMDNYMNGLLAEYAESKKQP